MTLILNGTDNSATTPAVTGTDTDTGVYYPAANQVALATNGTLALLVNSSQQFGIGVASPTFQLEMGGGTTVATRIQLNRGSDDAAQNLRLGWNAIKTTRTSNVLAVAQTNLDFVQVGSDGERVCFSMGTNGSLEVNLGIKFPATQVSSADANTLDDYEEGNWTPVPSFGGNNVGMSYSSAGRYTKIGRVVQLSCSFSITANGSSTGIWRVSGLPFPADIGSAGVFYGDSLTFTGASALCVVESGIANTVTMAIQTGGTGSLGGWSYMSEANSSGSGGKNIIVTYLTAT
jgi:hypothetical protein